VNRALKNIQVVNVDLALGMSLGTKFRNYLAEFLTKRAMARDKTHILLGRVYLEAEREEYVFQGQALMDFLTDTKRFNEYSAQQVAERLRTYGGRPERYLIDKKNPSVAVWRIPAEVIKDHVVNTDGIDDMSFLEAKEEF
jgi:hypothetical protein